MEDLIFEIVSEGGVFVTTIGFLVRWIINKVNNIMKEIKSLHDKMIIMEERTKNL